MDGKNNNRRRRTHAKGKSSPQSPGSHSSNAHRPSSSAAQEKQHYQTKSYTRQKPTRFQFKNNQNQLKPQILEQNVVENNQNSNMENVFYWNKTEAATIQVFQQCKNPFRDLSTLFLNRGLGKVFLEKVNEKLHLVVKCTNAPPNWKSSCDYELGLFCKKISSKKMLIDVNVSSNKMEVFSGESPSGNLFTTWDDKNHILCVSGMADEVAKKVEQITATLEAFYSTQNVLIEKDYHCFLNGANKTNANRVSKTYNVKIVVPPYYADDSKTIKISGPDENKVNQAIKVIMDTYLENKSMCTKQKIVFPASEKFTRNQLLDIFNKTEVFVKKTDENGCIELLGKPENLQRAQEYMILLANEIDYIQHVQGLDWVIRLIKTKYKHSGKANVNFYPESGKILIKGKKNDVDKICMQMKTKISNHKEEIIYLEGRLYEDIFVKEKQKTEKKCSECELIIKNNGTSPVEIKVRGEISEVNKVTKYLKTTITKLKQIFIKEVSFEAGLMKYFTGEKNVMDEIRNEFPLVKVTFLDDGLYNKNNIRLEGKQNVVTKCLNRMNELLQKMKLEDNKCTIEFMSFKSYNKNVIGKNGQMIEKLRTEYNVNIFIPKSDDMSSIIKVTGKKQNCKDAVQRIKEIERDVGKIEEVPVEVNDAFKVTFNAVGDRLSRLVFEQFSVIIETVNIDKQLILRGLLSDISKSKNFLSKITGENCGYKILPCKREHQVYALGYRNILEKKLRKDLKLTMLTSDNHAVDCDSIYLIGPKDNMPIGESLLKDLLKDMDFTKFQLNLTKKHFNFLTSKNETEMMQLLEKYPTVLISYSDALHVDKILNLSGPSLHVSGLEQDIRDKLEQLDNTFTEVQRVPIKFQSLVTDGVLKKISEDFAVQIEKRMEEKHLKIFIIGNKDGCSQAKEEIKSLLPKQEVLEIQICREYHGRIIGKGGAGIKAISTSCNVVIKFPDRDKNSDIVKIIGEPESVKNAFDEICRKASQFGSYPVKCNEEEMHGAASCSSFGGSETAAEDEERNIDNQNELDNTFTEVQRVPIKFQSLVTDGVLKKISEDFAVQIKKRMEEKHLNIYIIGNKDGCSQAKEEIKSLLPKQEVLEIQICREYHGRIIGKGGAGIKAISTSCNVVIKFPGRDSNSDIVKIIGEPESVKNAFDEICRKASQFGSYPVKCNEEEMHGAASCSSFGGSETAVEDEERNIDNQNEPIQAKCNDEETNKNAGWGDYTKFTTEDDEQKTDKLDASVLNKTNDKASTVAFVVGEPNPLDNETELLSSSTNLDNPVPEVISGLKEDSQDEPRRAYRKKFNIKRYGAYEVVQENSDYYKHYSESKKCTFSFDEYKSKNYKASLLYPLSGENSNVKINVICGDITQETCDCIVRSCDSNYNFHGQVSSKILNCGGEIIKSECLDAALYSQSAGDTIILTGGGSLKCKYIMHVPVDADTDKYKDIMVNILNTAKRNSIVNLVMPIIGTGGLALDFQIVVENLQKGVVQWQKSSLSYKINLTFCIYNNTVLTDVVKRVFNVTDGKPKLEIKESESSGFLSSIFSYFSSSRQTNVKNKDTNDNENTKENEKTDVNANATTVSAEHLKGVKIVIEGPKLEVIEVKSFIEKEVEDKTNELAITSSDQPILCELEQSEVVHIRQIATKNQIHLQFLKNQNELQLSIAGVRHRAIEVQFKVLIYLQTLQKERESLPKGWVKMGNEIFKRVEIGKCHPQYIEVERLFLSTAQNRNFKITKIERVQNPTLWKQFEAKQAEIKKKCSGSLDAEKLLFHGTPLDSIDQICSRGFDKGFCGVNGTAYGKGVYFSNTSCYSHSYTISGSSRYMFVCHVLTGNYIRGDSSMVAPPFLPNSQTERYDSVVDSSFNPSIFVVFRDADVYPAYVITYKADV